MKIRIYLISFLLVITSIACGGSDNNEFETVDPSGLYLGNTENGRSIAGIILSSGEYWVIYFGINNDSTIAGVVQGNGITDLDEFTSENGKDFNFETFSIGNVTIDANIVEKQSITGKVKYQQINEEIDFSGNYNSDFEDIPQLNNISGTYSGNVITADGKDSATITATNSGEIFGTTQTGCDVAGSVSPREDGNVYNVVITFQGGNCFQGTDTVRGIAYFDLNQQQIISAALNTSRTNGFLFLGNKQ